MSRSRRLFPAGISRLTRHSTTIDPYLDESGSSVRRLGPLALGGATYDALDLSSSMALSAELRTPARATLRIPCAATGDARLPVTFEVGITAAGEAERRWRLQVTPEQFGRWHVIEMRVPHATLSLTVTAVAASGDPASAGPVCGVPSLTWRKSPRAVSRSVAFAVRTLGVSGALHHMRTKMDVDAPAQYAEWRACHALDDEALARERAAAASLQPRPRFLLFLDVPPGTADALVTATLASLDAQVYPEWEVCRTDGAAARNAGLERSSADFVGAVRAGDRLSPVALLRAAQQAGGDADVDLLYTDEDVWPVGGEPVRPRFKPDWSPELLHACMYFGRLFLVRRTLVLQAGGYRAAMDGALDYDLALRTTAVARRIVHVPDVLYHRGALVAGHADSVAPASAAALAEACAHQGLTAKVVPGAQAGVWRARISVGDAPRIAIVIPTDGRGPAGQAPFIVQCVRSLRQRTRYQNYELLVCDNGNLTGEARAFLETVPHRRVTYTWEGAFNFPRKINFAVRQTAAPYVLLLNDDIEPINAEWLDAMLEYAHQPQIGAVGAKLFYPDGRLQHVGVAVGVCGVAAHLLHQHPGGTQGCGGIAVTARNCSAVTGACLLTRRDVYERVGGFDEALPLDFNDVDFCLRVGRAGYRIVFTPHARLFHYESASFGARRQRAEEVAAMWERWGSVLEHDPYYNVNLSREFPDCRIRPCR